MYARAEIIFFGVVVIFRIPIRVFVIRVFDVRVFDVIRVFDVRVFDVILAFDVIIRVFVRVYYVNIDILEKHDAFFQRILRIGF
jgi:hypothetical protein